MELTSRGWDGTRHICEKSSWSVEHLVTRPKAKSGATVCVVLCRDINSSQLVGRQMKSSGDISTSGYLQQAGYNKIHTMDTLLLYFLSA